ncbi:MAG TPA: type II toxin-antitoxin system VapB family antitoxin [Allosphingosinicella sp.]|nr:type II toxin-antitoxin system VapB family antitoxin [Allosphingosinicella sp.]
MGKYESLAARLESASANEWSATFAQVEQVLGFPLPPSARKYREWWSNQAGTGHSQARGWQDAGWQVWKVDLAAERVIFRRVDGGPSSTVGAQADGDERLIEQAGEYLGIQDRAQIIREALRALIQREAARRLSKLGGTMPDFKAPPRRRRFG